MGLLTLGSGLNWNEAKKYAEHVRVHGIRQFINLYNHNKDRQDPIVKWGDEVDGEKKRCQLSLRADELLQVMDRKESESGPDGRKVLWRPECGSFMVEGTPGAPYHEEVVDGHQTLFHLNLIEQNMALRRREMEELLNPGEHILSITSFPRLGCPDFCWPSACPCPETSVSGSIFLPDEATSRHPRFQTVVENIRSRRGKKLTINVPIFKDTDTKDPFFEVFEDAEAIAGQKEGHIFMDSVVFGMGCCCLQVTFQANNLREAVHLYDQLIPITPIAMAISAASPVQRGYLTNLDTRWSVICQAMDDRTEEEKLTISKSRYDSVDCYLSKAGEKFNDVDIVYNQEYFKTMVDGGVDPLIARHVAHLFIRDPIILFEEKLNQDDVQEADHFETIQSTNWQSMRFKPPPVSDPSIGWRIEFRTMEVQVTDFENASYAIFIFLLTRVILTYNVDMLIPILKVDENMNQAQTMDAVNDGKFWFRKEIFTKDTPSNVVQHFNQFKGCPCKSRFDDMSCVLMSANTIINGGDGFPGLIPLVRHFVKSLDIDSTTNCTIQKCLRLISERASGKCLTTATWMRNYIRCHPDYRFDSQVSDLINYDMINLMVQMSEQESIEVRFDFANLVSHSKKMD